MNKNELKYEKAVTDIFFKYMLKYNLTLDKIKRNDYQRKIKKDKYYDENTREEVYFYYFNAEPIIIGVKLYIENKLTRFAISKIFD